MSEALATGAPTDAPCARCGVAHNGRLPCDGDALALRLQRDAPRDVPLAARLDAGRPHGQAVRRRPTVNSFGWFGRVACTLPPFLLLYTMAHVMGMGTKLFVLTVGSPMLFFTIWWTKHVWESPRRRR